MTWLLLNIPLAALFFALWVGIPLWMVFKHPDTGPVPAATPATGSAVTPATGPAVTHLPERQRADADHRRAA
jgi:hypothetical protein